MTEPARNFYAGKCEVCLGYVGSCEGYLFTVIKGFVVVCPECYKASKKH